MKTKPLIYIIMATYNGEKYIKEQINSILNQSYINWKLIIHDDNSLDKTVSFIRKYQKEDNRIKLVDDNISTGGAKENFTYILNKIDNNYEYIMFCDQDDVWLENKIEITLNKMIDTEKNNTSIPILIHTDLKVVDKELNIISNSMFRYQKLNIKNQYSLNLMSMENIITGCTMMLNKNLSLLSKDIPNEAIMHDWWIGIIVLRENGLIEFVDKATILYRQHELNTIGSKKINFIYYLKKLFKIKESINDYKIIYIQYKKAKIDIFIFKYIFIKLFLILKKAVKI